MGIPSMLVGANETGIRDLLVDHALWPHLMSRESPRNDSVNHCSLMLLKCFQTQAFGKVWEEVGMLGARILASWIQYTLRNETS